ncbi:MAG: hypothetical protein ABI528_03495 [bacterium]
MAKPKPRNIQALKTKRSRKEQSHLHFAMTSKNYMMIGLGVAIIILGYFFMSANSVDGFLPTTIAPILLILGYCVVVPIGILYKDKNVNEKEVEEIREIKTEIKPTLPSSSSNIKTA